MRQIVLGTVLLLAIAGAVIGGFYAVSSAGTGAPLPADLKYATTRKMCGEPRLVVLPKITGTIAVGSTLHVSTGIWTCDPAEFRYSWGSFGHAGWGRLGSSRDLLLAFRDDFFASVSACVAAVCSPKVFVCVADPNNPPGDNPAAGQLGDPIAGCRNR